MHGDEFVADHEKPTQTQMRTTFRSLVDSSFPSLSRQYRQIRDFTKFKRLKPYKTCYGFQLLGDAGLDTSRSESREVQVFMDRLQHVDLFIDIGANVGLFTCLAAQGQKPVLAIEPHPYNLRCLYYNLEYNSFSQVEILPIALSNCVGVLPLIGGGQGASLVNGWGGIKSSYHTMVPVNTLDNLLYDRLRGKRLLIKVDVEGNEFNLLQESTRILSMAPHPVWMVEHGLTENFGGAINPFFEDVFELFWKCGYQAITIDGESRVIAPADVKRWVEQRKRDFGGINFLFQHA